MHARATRFAFAALLTAFAASPALAQDPNYSTTRTSAPLPPTVSFRSQPTWVKVPGTTVSVIQQDQRPTYDMFALDNQYYIYNEGHWYRSGVANGPYVSLELNAIPPEFHAVPRASWVNYPSGWDMPASTTPATADTTNWVPTVSFKTAPHWQSVPASSRVYYVQKSERPAYDLFKYDNRFYTYQNGNWYSSTTTNGPYALVATEQVPSAFRTVKQTYWVSYPKGWTYQLPSTINSNSAKVKTSN
jgi:hypothetical protein